jgi:tetratricopeptide (TPR) repeat protein
MSPERPPKVFISYSHDSNEHEERVLNLADRLAHDGIDVDLDQFVSPPPASWPIWMERAMEAANFILVVCSKNYLAKVKGKVKRGTGKGVKWESLLSYQEIYDNDSNSSKYIPVLLEGGKYEHIPDPMRGGNHYKPEENGEYEKLLRHITNQPATPKPILGKVKELPPKARRGAKNSATTGKQPSSPSRLWNVPHTRNEAFTGREQILSNLRADLLKKGKQALFGLGGVGKTQIAVEYAYRHQDEYKAVFWSFAGTEQSLRGGYAAIAGLLDLPEKDSQEQAKVTDAVKNWLEHNAGWLLVLDNADDPAMVKAFLPQQGKGHILLTSRAYVFHKTGILSPREINVLSPDEAREFLMWRTGKETTEQSTEVDALANEMGYLPLALEQAAAYMSETGASFSNYLVGYRKQRLKLLEKQGPVIGNDEKEQQKRTVATTWAVNFADVEKSSPASAELLRLSAFLAPDATPLELLEKSAEELPKALAAKMAEAADNPLGIDELLSPLLRYSLVRREDEKRTYSIHPLVQEVVRDGLSKEHQRVWAERAVRVVNLAFPDPEFENWPACDRFLPHALVCAGFINCLTLEFAEAARLLNQASCYLNDRAEYAQAEPLCSRALEIYEKALGKEHPTTARGMNNLAFLYHNQGRKEEAELLYRRALEITEKTRGAEHSWTAIGLNNLAALYLGQGRYEEAEPLQLRALAITEKTQGAKHPWTAIRLNNLAELYRLQGRFGEAEPLYRRAIEIREKALGAGHPDTAYSLNCLAVLFDTQGKHGEAELLYMRALAIREKVLGPEHPNTILVRNNLIGFYREQGRDADAVALEKAAKNKAE